MIKIGEDYMIANKVLRYQGVTKRKEAVSFSVEECTEKPCWEMASDAGDLRSAFNICEDCIVFLLKNGTTLLSEEEIRSIGNREISCKFYSA